MQGGHARHRFSIQRRRYSKRCAGLRRAESTISPVIPTYLRTR
jgi:hypothetical protein